MHRLNVSLESGLLREPSPTASLIAQKRLLTEVNRLDVTVEIRFLSKKAAASWFRAREVFFAAMDESHVLDQVAVLLEGGPAFLAPVRLFARGCARGLVLLPRSAARKGPSTLRTFPWWQNCVPVSAR